MCEYKIGELRQVTVDVEPNIFGITETWIKSDADNSECN